MPRQTWRDYFLHFYVCESCAVVDRDDERVRPGHPCKRCGSPSNMGVIYFDSTVGDIADLIAGFYPIPDPELGQPISPVIAIPESHSLAILVFFCTLGEILLQHFLERCMINLQIPYKVQQRLLDDNLFARQRITRLFPILTGAKWSDAVKVVSDRSKTDLQSTINFYIEANEKRNQLLHVGNTWDVPPDMAKNCFDNIAPLVQLFIELHNEYITKPI
jgi:hypothetical protein